MNSEYTRAENRNAFRGHGFQMIPSWLIWILSIFYRSRQPENAHAGAPTDERDFCGRVLFAMPGNGSC